MHTSVSALHSPLPATDRAIKWHKERPEPEKKKSPRHCQHCRYFLILHTLAPLFSVIMRAHTMGHSLFWMASFWSYLSLMHSFAVGKGNILFCVDLCELHSSMREWRYVYNYIHNSLRRGITLLSLNFMPSELFFHWWATTPFCTSSVALQVVKVLREHWVIHEVCTCLRAAVGQSPHLADQSSPPHTFISLFQYFRWKSWCGGKRS